MKIISIILFAFFSLFASQQPARLKGNYKLLYDNKYQLQTCQVTFADSTFVKKLPDGLTTKGKISYQKYKVMLTPNNDNPIELDGRELLKDTIKFTTRQKTDLSMVLNRGKLIRMK